MYYCHDTWVHCVCVVRFVKTLGLSPLRLLGVWVSKLFPFGKLRGAWPEGSGPAWGKGTEGRYPFCASRRYGGVGAGALPLGSMRYKHDSEDNEDEDTNLQKIPVYKKT